MRTKVQTHPPTMASNLEYIYEDGVIPDDVLLTVLDELLGVRERPCTELAGLLEYLKDLAESAVQTRLEYEQRVDATESAQTRAEYDRAIAFIEVAYAQFDAARVSSVKCQQDMGQLAAPPPIYTQEMHLLQGTAEGRALRNFVTPSGRIDEVYYSHFRERALQLNDEHQMTINRTIVGNAVLAIHVVYAHRMGVPFLQDITASTYATLVRLAEELSLHNYSSSPRASTASGDDYNGDDGNDGSPSPQPARGRGTLASSLQSSIGAIAYSVTDVEVPANLEGDGRRAVEFHAVDIPRESAIRIIALPHKGTGEMQYRHSAQVIDGKILPELRSALASILQSVPARTRLHMIASLDGIPTMMVSGVTRSELAANVALQKHIRVATIRLREMFTPAENYPPPAKLRTTNILPVESRPSSSRPSSSRPSSSRPFSSRQ